MVKVKTVEGKFLSFPTATSISGDSGTLWVKQGSGSDTKTLAIFAEGFWVYAFVGSGADAAETDA